MGPAASGIEEDGAATTGHLEQSHLKPSPVASASVHGLPTLHRARELLERDMWDGQSREVPPGPPRPQRARGGLRHGGTQTCSALLRSSSRTPFTSAPCSTSTRHVESQYTPADATKHRGGTVSPCSSSSAGRFMRALAPAERYERTRASLRERIAARRCNWRQRCCGSIACVVVYCGVDKKADASGPGKQ